jgi:hypothetical protein
LGCTLGVKDYTKQMVEYPKLIKTLSFRNTELWSIMGDNKKTGNGVQLNKFYYHILNVYRKENKDLKKKKKFDSGTITSLVF